MLVYMCIYIYIALVLLMYDILSIVKDYQRSFKYGSTVLTSSVYNRIFYHKLITYPLHFNTSYVIIF